MAHKFGIHNKHKLDNEKRREALPPSKTLVDLGLEQGDVVADIGCGIGYFSIPAAEIVGKSGIVWALDISEGMIKDLEKKIEENNISNIKTILTDENDLKIENNSVSFAFICNMLHEADEMEVFLKDVMRVVNENGKMVIVEWKKEETDYGPPLDHRLNYEEVTNIVAKLGFKNIKYQEVGKYFYAVIAEK